MKTLFRRIVVRRYDRSHAKSDKLADDYHVQDRPRSLSSLKINPEGQCPPDGPKQSQRERRAPRMLQSRWPACPLRYVPRCSATPCLHCSASEREGTLVPLFSPRPTNSRRPSSNSTTRVPRPASDVGIARSPRRAAAAQEPYKIIMRRNNRFAWDE
jgi:hypothetical protein